MASGKTGMGRLVGPCAGLLALVALGCPGNTPPPERPASPRAPSWRVQSFSETSPISSIVAQEQAIYAGTAHGLLRFDAQSGAVRRITTRDGLSGDRVDAVAAGDRGELWAATDGGLSQRGRDGKWTTLPAPAAPGETVRALLVGEAGLWAGGSFGVSQLVQGSWTSLLPGAHVTCMMQDIRGDGLWVGTDGEGIHHRGKDGRLANYSPASGQVLRKVNGMAFSDSGALVAVGRGQGGHGLVFYDGQRWTAYRPHPDLPLRWVQRAGRRLLLAAGEQVLQLALPRDEAADLRPGPLVLRPALGPARDRRRYPAPRIVTRPLERWLPPHATAVASRGAEVFVGTASAGLVRFDGKFFRWYRTGDLQGPGRKLKLACDADACYLAGGEGRLYAYDGQRFHPQRVNPDEAQRVVAVFNDASGAVQALLAGTDGRSLGLFRRQGKQWVGQRSYALRIPQGAVQARFVRLAPDGTPWVGLAYASEDGESHPWGVVLLRDDGTLLYHRSSTMPKEPQRPRGSLALPDDIRDVTFDSDGTAWVATGSGICRVRGQQVRLITEREGLASELVSHVALGPDGALLAATFAGLGQLRAGEWRFAQEGPLATPCGSILREGTSALVATSRGIVRLSAPARPMLSGRNGLGDDRVLDLWRDPRGRLWVLGESAVSVVVAARP